MSESTPDSTRSNQDKLAGLTQPTPAPQPSKTAGVPPWENKPSSETTASTNQPAVQPAPNPSQASSPPQIPALATPATIPNVSGMPLAGIWNRTWCWFLDSIAAFFVALILTAVITSPIAILAPDSAAAGVIGFFGIIAGFLTYFAAAYRWWGRTPIMMIPRLYVVDAASGSKLGWGRAYLRALILSLAQALGLLAIIWLAVASSSALKQGPHDKAARSLVVQRPR